ncbi:hypothetical protein PENTCL1PPCAC_6114, partial [Pristionchus entomophagus]
IKILLALPLLVLVGCALAEEQSISTSTICINGNCIDCLNGVCESEYRSPPRVKRKESHWNHEGCFFNFKLSQWQCTGFNCTDGSSIHH